MAELTPHARRLRRDMTPAESVLWKQVRGSRLGVRFRRQEPLLGYIVDFLAKDVHLVIELDGQVHGDLTSDLDRDLTLQRNGYRVLRIENADVFHLLEEVLEEISRLVTDPTAKPTRKFELEPEGWTFIWDDP